MDLFRRLAVFLPSLLLAGCGGIDMIVYSIPGAQPNFAFGDYRYAIHRGAIVAEVGGNTLSMPKDDFAKLVRGHLYGALDGPDIDIVPTDTKHTVSPFKIVAVFDAAPRVGAEEICRSGAAVPTEVVKGRTRLDLVFCLGTDLKSETAGVAWGLSGTDDPRFLKLIRDVAITLIPQQEDRENDDPIIKA